jgi:PAS domain S-box-containing protein
MSEGVVMFDSKGQIIAANDSAARALGVSRDEITARSVFDPRWRLHHEDGRPMSVEEYPPVVTLRTCAASENVIIGVSRPDGELRWVSINCAPIWLDATHREWGAVTTVNDITERRKVELQARRDRERLAAIVDSAMDGVISTDSEMRITVFNRAAERMFGRSERAMLGQPLDALLPVRFRSAHRDLMQSFATSGLAKRVMGVPGQVTGMRADGEEFPLEASIARVSVGDETILTVILRDISERVRAEEQRQQLEGQLRQSQKMQSLGTLTGGIAHDFNNILTAITGNAKLAIDDLPRTHPVQRSLVEIDKAAARATNLVRQVLAFGRRQEAQRVVVDMAVVVGEALNFLRAMIPATIDIRSRFAEHLPRVAADKTQVHQVITNLGSNAAHAIGDRPGFIDVSLDEVRITEAEAQRSLDLDAGLYLRLSFSDNGDGIESAVLDRIFEPFFTTKSLGQGTGLGLSVVHGIMKNHDGSISVHSTRGAGTRFDLYFPGCAQASATAPIEIRRALDDANTGRGKTVIYVDDEEALVFLVTRILERRGYKVLGFNQPRHALAELTKNPQRIDALISDLAMPGMTGFDVAREAFALRPDLPIIVVSGYIRPQDATTAHALGVQRMILKPDTVDALAAALHEVLEASERVNAS